MKLATSYEHKCCTANSVLWNSGSDSNKKIASSRKRKLNFYSNVYIVKNPANPELEGKVMLFRYGKKIFDKIMSAMKPEFEDDTPIDPFCMWNGADFKIRVKTVKEVGSGASYPSYDDSVFLSPQALSDDDEELERIWNQCHSLNDLIAPDKFKTEDELKQRLSFVLGSPVQEQENEVEEQFSESNIMKELEDSYTRKPSSSFEDEDDDEDASAALSRFQELAG